MKTLRQELYELGFQLSQFSRWTGQAFIYEYKIKGKDGKITSFKSHGDLLDKIKELKER